MTEQLNKRVHVVLTTLLAFFIPLLPIALPILIVLLSLNWLINISNVKISVRAIKHNTALTLMIVLYALYLVGLIYSSNFKFAGEILETKFSFLILPLVYAAYTNETKLQLSNYLKSFIFGCITYAMLCFAYATYAFYKPVYTDLYGVLYDLGSNYFYYSYLSSLFHPSYASMYAVVVLFSSYYLYKKEFLKLNYFWISVIAMFSIYILLLSSKAGWIGLIFIYTVFIIDLIRNSKYIIAITIVGLLVGLFLFLNVYYAPLYAQRIPKAEVIENAINEKDKDNKVVTTSTDGTGSRIFVWKASFEVIKENLILGVGTGDSRDKLMEKYLEKNMKTEYEFGLNSHNQFLNTTVSIGIIGLIVLMLCFWMPFYQGWKQKELLLMGFVVVVAMNLLFESMFERQSGVIFYVFLNTILCSTFVPIKSNKY
ncbi:MAG: O-antigen ligase family protein [Bacteroidetes bacterium]|nr:O-antigen ligase family protein [Bacteroidota bacterium]